MVGFRRAITLVFLKSVEKCFELRFDFLLFIFINISAG